MHDFIFSTCQHIRCASGASHQLGEICAERGNKVVLIVTDPGIHQLGLLDEPLNSLRDSNIASVLFTEVEADPSEATILSAVALAKQASVDLVIGFGGGSSMDVAKLVAFLAHPACSQSLDEIYGLANACGPRLALIQVPTTAGTGSEVTPVAIVTTGATTKMGAVSPILLPDLALLDATLTRGLPKAISAATGVDAMVHAIEAYTSAHKKNPVSDMLAREALKLLSANIHRACFHGDDLNAREQMLMGALFAGQAFANSPVAAVHALAYPLGGHFHIPHGLSNALVLPHVLRFNLEAAADLYAELAPIMFPEQDFVGSPFSIAQTWIGLVETMLAELDLNLRLRDMGIEASSLPMLAQDAMLQTRLLVNNPRALNYEDALNIYKAAY